MKYYDKKQENALSTMKQLFYGFLIAVAFVAIIYVFNLIIY